MTVHGLPSESCEDITVELTGEQRDTLSVCAAPKSPRVFCEVMVPIKYGKLAPGKTFCAYTIREMESSL